MAARKLVLGSLSAALLMIGSQAQAVTLTPQLSGEKHSAVAVAATAYDAAPFSSAKTSKAAPPALNSSWRNFALETAPTDLSSDDRRLQTLGLLFGRSPKVDRWTLAKTAAEIRAYPSIAPPPRDCPTGGLCTITAAAIPGPVWLVVSALLGLLGVGTRRPRFIAS